MNIPAPFSRILPGGITMTPPIISLLAANLLMIVFAISGEWDPATVMFIYWAQSVTIGIFTVFSLLRADTGALAADLGRGLRKQGGSGEISPRTVWFYKTVAAGFFAIHYGLFHWLYLSFIIETGLFGTIDFSSPDLWISCGAFFANHLFSYAFYRNDTISGATFFAVEFFRPYARIIPMHLTILFGLVIVLILTLAGIPAGLPVLVLFIILKTGTDIAAHRVKHAAGQVFLPGL
jgi:hypothetical protein